jgi:tetratricopeptide (TPR) repeat protein
VLLTLLLGGCGYGWLWRQREARRAETARKVDEALEKAALLRGKAAAAAGDDLSGWIEAMAEAQRAQDLLDQGEGNPAMQERVAAVREELDQGRAKAEERARDADAERRLVVRLETIRNNRGEHYDDRRADRDYAEAFREFGLDLDRIDPVQAGAKLRGRPATAEIAAALDVWARLRRVVFAGEKSARSWWRLSEAAQSADPDPWRNALRRAIRHKVPDIVMVLRKQADDIEALQSQPVTSLILLASALNQVGDRERFEAVLRMAWRRFPGDYWVNAELGRFFCSSEGGYQRPDEGVRFMTAALASRPRSTAAHNNLGNAFLEQDKVIEAIASFRQAIMLNPKNSGAHNNLGNALSKQGKLDEAIASYRQAIMLDPKDAFPHNNLGSTLSDQGKLDEAIASYRQAITLDPKYAPPHFNLGRALHKQGKVDEAIASYRQATKLDPKFARAHNSLGAGLHEQGKVDEAIASYRRAITLDPKHVFAHNNLGNALSKQGKVDEAIACYRQAITLDPKYVWAHFSLGKALSRQGKVDEAIASFRQAIKVDPNHAEAYISLGALLCDVKLDYDAAIAASRKAIALDPKLALAHMILGVALSAQGKVDEAIASCRRAIGLNPKNAPVHFSLGNALSKQGKLDEAIACYRQAITLDPKYVWAHYCLGDDLRKQGKIDEAIASFREAIKVGPDRAEAYISLGALLCDVKLDYDAAIAAFRKAIALDPKDTLAHSNLGHALFRKGKLTEAIACYRQALNLLPPGDPRHMEISRHLQRALRRRELETNLPAILASKLVPASAAERAEYARLCAAMKKYQAASRLYFDALADDPKLADDLRTWHRYSAACYAALAGCGQGSDAGERSDQARLRWRRQALSWLRADLSLHRHRLARGPSLAKQSREALLHWQTDRDLAGLRDKDALAKLSPEERQACEKLWADVEALLRQSKAKPAGK